MSSYFQRLANRTGIGTTQQKDGRRKVGAVSGESKPLDSSYVLGESSQVEESARVVESARTVHAPAPESKEVDSRPPQPSQETEGGGRQPIEKQHSPEPKPDPKPMFLSDLNPQILLEQSRMKEVQVDSSGAQAELSSTISRPPPVSPNHANRTDVGFNPRHEQHGRPFNVEPVETESMEKAAPVSTAAFASPLIVSKEVPPQKVQAKRLVDGKTAQPQARSHEIPTQAVSFDAKPKPEPAAKPAASPQFREVHIGSISFEVHQGEPQANHPLSSPPSAPPAPKRPSRSRESKMDFRLSRHYLRGVR